MKIKIIPCFRGLWFGFYWKFNNCDTYEYRYKNYRIVICIVPFFPVNIYWQTFKAK